MTRIRERARPQSRSGLRREWESRTAVGVWAFPSDWHVAAVDAVCEAIVAGEDPWPAAERLGRDRAAAGISLGEALADIDSLAGLVATADLERLRRAVSLGWADRIIAPAGPVIDPLTGLASADYLKTRLGEVYRAASVGGVDVPQTSALVVARQGMALRSWRQMSAMVVLGEGLRVVFDGGQTLAALGPATAVVLVERVPVLACRARLAADLLADRLLREGLPAARVWVEDLPLRFESVPDLLQSLRR